MANIRVIVGQGTATEVFRSTAATHGWITIVLGARGLWADMMGHRMGQPPQLLALPGQPVPSHAAASGRTAEGLRQFKSADDFQQELGELSRRNDARDHAVHLDTCRAQRIVRVDGHLRVVTTNPNWSIPADEVILATGIPPQQALAPPGGIHGAPDPGAGFPQVIEGLDYIARFAHGNPPPVGLMVAIYGGGATSAWIADIALSHQPRNFAWIARPGGSGFSGCDLPGDRNWIVLQQTADRRQRAELRQVTYLPALRSAGRLLRRPMVRLVLRADGSDRVALVDQLIYSIGGDNNANGSVYTILDPWLRRELEPIFDKNRVLSSGTGTLAWGTRLRDLFIVGAATYNYQGLAGKQIAPMATLPRNAQVPDGIAMAVASISALNNHIPITQDEDGNVLSSDININTADRNQLAAYLAVFHPDLGPAACNEIVVRTIDLRSRRTQGREFGITEQEFANLIAQYA